MHARHWLPARHRGGARFARGRGGDERGSVFAVPDSAADGGAPCAGGHPHHHHGHPREHAVRGDDHQADAALRRDGAPRRGLLLLPHPEPADLQGASIHVCGGRRVLRLVLPGRGGHYGRHGHGGGVRHGVAARRRQVRRGDGADGGQGDVGGELGDGTGNGHVARSGPQPQQDAGRGHDAGGGGALRRRAHHHPRRCVVACEGDGADDCHLHGAAQAGRGGCGGSGLLHHHASPRQRHQPRRLRGHLRRPPHGHGVFSRRLRERRRHDQRSGMHPQDVPYVLRRLVHCGHQLRSV
mmetsp:Transcript_46220/g.88215  ORF Transcript_46220/g.88215 Transcript_46220/m.88215 type:complete len:296 (+) Transcript_46220:511-1398(+)